MIGVPPDAEDIMRFLTGGLTWIWTNGAAVGALAAAFFTAWYAWLTYGIFRLQQTPVVTADHSTRSGPLEDNHELRSIRNSGQGPAFNVCIHQKDAPELLAFSWLGSLGPGETRELRRPVHIDYVEDHAHFIWYQDAKRRWYSTRMAAHGYGLASVWQGRRWRLIVPVTVRHNAKAETVVQFYRRLARWTPVRKLLSKVFQR